MVETDQLGYRLHSKPYPHAPGCTRLDVTLRAAPTGLHFDPEKIHLTVATPSGDVRTMILTQTSGYGPEPLRVCAGRVALVDRLEKRVQFVTLGGHLNVTHEDDHSLCRLSSSAPIIELSLTRDVPEILAEEIEDILAQRRAHWEVRSREFDRRLAAAEPSALYMASLVALQQKLRTMRHGAFDDDANRLAHFLDAEVAFLCGGGAVSGPPLEDIL